jgi:hypothetical protein
MKNKIRMAREREENWQRYLHHHPDSVPNHHRVIRELAELFLEPDVTRGVGTVNIKLGAGHSWVQPSTAVTVHQPPARPAG